MDLPAVDISSHAVDLRETWQARALIETDRSMFGMVVLSVLAHNFDEAMPTLLRVAFPGFQTIRAPFLCSAAKIDHRGWIVADMVTTNGQITRDYPLWSNTTNMRDTFRKLGDKLKLSDDERKYLFAAVQNWVVADRRLDPTMDRRDPDAKRITIN